MCRFSYTVDVDRLREMWADTMFTFDEVRRAFGLTKRQLDHAVETYELGPRGSCRRAFSMEDAESPEEDAASGESLAFSPWVASRIKELRLGMPA